MGSVMGMALLEPKAVSLETSVHFDSYNTACMWLMLSTLLDIRWFHREADGSTALSGFFLCVLTAT